MKYTQYGISFNLLKEEDIEMVRQWRNDPVVSGNYEYREHITPEMQQEWFKSVNNINNLYTIIEYQREKIGVINIKNINWEERVCEGGIFFPDPKHHQSFIPAVVSYITTEIIFKVFEWNISYAHVLKENRSVQTFVKMLGYELMPGQEDVNNQQYQVTVGSFEKNVPKIKKAISALMGNDTRGVFRIERHEFSDPVVLQWEEKVKTSRFIVKVETTSEGRFYYFS
ncbi:MAG: GNAT family N-acetyltransferase [Bacteroidales bacterium]|nr:GNAT family N-acetyltransferase [Bacteroidales bacterium]